MIGIICLLAATNAAAERNQGADTSEDDPAIVGERWLQAVVRNVRERLHVLVLEDDRGKRYVRRKDLLELDLTPPATPAIHHRGERFHTMASMTQHRLTIDPGWGILFVNPPRPPPESPDPGTLKPTWMETNVNETGDRRIAMVLEGPGNTLYLDAELLDDYRLRHAGDPVQKRDRMFLPASRLPSVRPVIDRRKQSLTLYAAADGFRATKTRATAGRMVKTDFDTRGAFMNYSVFGTANERRNRLDGQIELAGFAGRGLFTTTHLQRGLTGGASGPVRLESGLRFDWPQSMHTLRLGDTTDFPGAWGRPVRFGGIRWGTNFATQPGFITFPMPTVRGETALPATVDVFVDNARRATREVPPGPFSIRDVPVVTGAGDMRMVVRDALGRERVVSMPFYASTRLLRSGLHEYSYEIGKVRRDFGLASNRYGRAFAAGTHRYGITDRLTGELRGELLADQMTLGIAGNFLWPATGEFHMAVAASRDSTSGEQGQLVELGFRRQTRLLSFGANIRGATADFVQLGQDRAEEADALRTRAFAGIGLGHLGSLALSHVRRQRRARDDDEFATLQYSTALGRFAHLTLNVLHPLSGGIDRSAGLMLSIPLGGRRSAQVGGTHNGAGSSGSLAIRRNLPAGRGIGYRVASETGARERHEVGIGLRGEHATANIRTAEAGGRREHRASLDGGIAFMDGQVHLSRPLRHGFALVQVPGHGDVTIYQDNRPVATTAADGTALVPNLRAYQDNPIRIADADLPLDIAVETLQTHVTPAYRRGIRIRFDVGRSHWVAFQARTESGEPIPAGTELRDKRTGAAFSMGYAGQAHVEGQPGSHVYRARWQGHDCEVTLVIPDSGEIMPDLGRKTCR